MPKKMYYGNIGQLKLDTNLIDIQNIKPDEKIDELHYKPDIILMKQFGTFTLNKWRNASPGIDQIISGNEISITYTDSYLRGPLGCMLFLEILRVLVSEWSVKIRNVELLLGKIDESSSLFDNRVYRNWHTNKARRRFMYEALKTFLKISEITVQEVDYKKMVHYRYLSIHSPEHTITIRPDGGIENGWAVLSAWDFPFRAEVLNQLKEYAAKRKLMKIGPRKDVDLLTYILVESKNKV